LRAGLELDRLPILNSAPPLASQGFHTGAGTRNRETWRDKVSLPDGLPDWRRDLLYDPQTSGGLLLAVEPGAADEVLDLFHARDYADARIIGQLGAGKPHITVS
jgi:selenide,water dikinase